MNIDIRLKLDFFEHPKARKLRRRLGAEGVLCLLRLWLWAAANRPEGILRGLDADDLELAAQWEGQPGELVAALCEFRLLDAPPASPFSCGESAPGEPETAGENPAAPDCPEARNSFRIHDWAEHQAWACRSEERTKKARRAAQSRWDKESLENFQEKQSDENGACSNMLRAFSSNAPRAKSQKPETKAKAEPAHVKAAKAAEVPALRSASGQGRGEGATCEPAAKPEGRGAYARSEAYVPAVASVPAGASARSGASVPAVASVRSGASVQDISASPIPPGQAGKGDIPRQDAAPASLPARGESAAFSQAVLPPPVQKAAFSPEAGQGRAELVAELVPEPVQPSARSQKLAFSGFTPPSFAEVELYCGQRGNGIDPRRFLDWCEARGWKVGGQTIRDWRALIRRWEKREREANSPQSLRGVDSAELLPASGAPPGVTPGAPSGAREVPQPGGGAAFAPACGNSAGRAPSPAPAPELPALGMQAARPYPARTLPEAPSPQAGMAGARPSSVHQALVRERDLIARMILNEKRANHARFPGNSAASGTPQPALPPEWAHGR